MQPEDIDKLFREQLQGHAPTPPAFLWDEIEARIEPQRRQRPVLWLAAACVALLALLGGTWLVLMPAGRSQTGTLAATENRPADTKKIISQATPAPALPSSPIETPATQPAAEVATSEPSQTRSAGVQPDPAPEASRAALASRPARMQPAPSALSQPQKTTLDNPVSPATLVATVPAPTAPVALPEPVAPKPAQAVAAASSAPIGPIEVEVRPAATAVAAAPETGRRPLLGNLLLQARNAVRGDKVSLTAAGLPEVVTVQAHVGHRVLTKVIQL